MSWLSMLCQVYDNCSSEIGKYDERGIVLFPIAHSTIQIQIEIVINQAGNFIRARRLSKEDSETLVPVTEDSVARSSGINPMPLFDKLCYIAGDFDTYIHPAKSMKQHHQMYMDQLEQWAEKEDTPIDIKSIYQYLKKDTVIADLQKANVFESEKDFVRFVVIDENNYEAATEVLWKNEKAIQNYVSFYLSTLDGTGIDYTTGNDVVLTNKLPYKIRNSGDMSKLISSNDTSGFTYRGRFLDAQQAAGIGYLSGQKGHNALRWLIAKQGYRNDSECIVCFSDGKVIPPNPCSYDPFCEIDDKVVIDTKELYAEQINLALKGYKTKFAEIPNSKVAIMALDTADGANQGRLAIQYYTEMTSNVFLDNLKSWYQNCIWEHNYRKNAEKKYIKFIGAPLPIDITIAAYGIENAKGILEVNPKIRKKSIDRILPCIAQKKRFPKDILLAVVRNAGQPQRYSSYNAHKILTIACALIHKKQIEEGKEVYNMSLNKNNIDRSYLFGRLLAIADRIEERIYYADKIQGRDTNAKKYWSAFVRKPAKTWAVIYEKLLPYKSKLSGSTQNYYSLLLEEVHGKLEDHKNFNNEPLSENYLLGYYSQYEALRYTKQEETENE